jgi:hypothetical protein
MDSIIITWRELLLVLAAVLAVYIAEMLLLLRRGGNPGWRLWQRGAQAHAQAQALGELRGQIEALRVEAAQLRARLDRHDAQASGSGPRGGDGAAERLAAFQAIQGASGAPAGAGSPESSDTPYGYAIRMAREGRSVTELASGCGISRGEAELIVALYRSSSPH